MELHVFKTVFNNIGDIKGFTNSTSSLGFRGKQPENTISNFKTDAILHLIKSRQGIKPEKKFIAIKSQRQTPSIFSWLRGFDIGHSALASRFFETMLVRVNCKTGSKVCFQQ